MEPSPEHSVEQYLEDIITTVHGGDLDAQLRKAMYDDLAERFNQRMILTVLTQLTEEQQSEFETIASAKERHGEIESFLRARIPGYDELMIGTMQQFRDDYFAGSGLTEDADSPPPTPPNGPATS